MLRSQEWQDLSAGAKLVYIGIKYHYDGRNNGEIPFRYVDSPVARSTTSRALKELRNKGWIEVDYDGGAHRYTCYYTLTGDYDEWIK
jgi:hypothetical protein